MTSSWAIPDISDYTHVKVTLSARFSPHSVQVALLVKVLAATLIFSVAKNVLSVRPHAFFESNAQSLREKRENVKKTSHCDKIRWVYSLHSPLEPSLSWRS